MKRVLKVGISIMSILILFTGCVSNWEKKDEQIKIGLLMDSLVIERWQRDRDMFLANAKEKGAEVIVQNANESIEKQIEQTRQLINSDVDVLVIIPYDKDGFAEVIAEAKKKGIKVISYDRLILNADIDAYISFDNVKVGELMGQAIIENVPQGNYSVINGSTFDHNSYMFNKGYMGVLKPYVESGQIEVIDEQWADDWREDVVYESLNRLLKEGQTLDAVICANDRLAESAIRVLSEYRLAGEVQVVGHDANLVACQQIVEGTQLMTVYKPINQLATAAVDLAIDLVNKDEIGYGETINNGFGEIPYIMIEPIAVNKDNIMETVIADGFHKFEDVYRYIPENEWPKRTTSSNKEVE